MIVYNMRYRGAIEYDKMALNILSFHNEVESLCEDEPKISELKQTLGSYLNSCNLLIDEFEKLEGAGMTKLKKERDNFIAFESGIGESY